MKILHIVPSYLPAYRQGGPIRSVHDLNKWLVKSGADVTVYTTNAGLTPSEVPLGKEVLLDGVKVFYFPLSFPRGWKNSRELNLALKTHIKDFDVVHITSTFLAPTHFGSKYALKAGVPYIISPRGNLMRDTYHNKFLKKKIYVELFERKALENSSAIHFTAEAEKEEYLAEGLPLKHTIVLPNGLDAESFGKIPERGYFRKKFEFAEKDKIILFLGRISWKKGFDTLVPAMAEVLKKVPNALLAVAGSDDENYQREVERMARESGILHKIRFLGMLLGEDKNGAFQDSDIFALPSYSENFGNAVTEAMYFGLPVVITKGVAISGDIAEGGAGLVTEKETAPFADAMELALQNREVAKKISERGKKLVREKYSWPEIAKKFILEYEKLI